MSRRLPESKTLIVRESGGDGHIFFVILITNFQGLEDIFGGLSLGGEVLDKQVDGCGWCDGRGSRQGRGSSFSVSNHLGTVVPFGFPHSLS